MKISIVMTAYNMEQYIEEAMMSCLNQTHEDIELVVVEDCSTDNTLAVIEEIATKDSRVKIIKHDTNMGAGMGRRDGINAATGDYFITVDADDWLDEDFIKALVIRAEKTGADIVSGGITVERGEGYWEKTCYGDVVTTGIDKIKKFWGEKIVFMNNKIIRTSFREKIPYCSRRFIEDTPTIIPMLHIANQVDYVSNTGYHYRMQEDSLTHKADPFKYALFRALCCMDLIDYFKDNKAEYVLNEIPIQGMLQKQIDIIKHINPDNDTIKKYLDEWLEFTKKLFA
jgi:glycosyltransferase involved in cell wall biosynthesis